MFGALLLVHPRAKKTAATDRGERVKKRQNWCWKDWGPKVPVWKSSCISTCGLLFSHPVVSNSATPWTAACQASLSLTISQSLPKFVSIASVTPSSCLILWHPLLLPSIFPSIRVFSNGSSHQVAKIWASASASVLPMNIQDWFPLGLMGLISLLSSGLSRVFSNTTIQKHQFFGARPSLWPNSHIHTWLGKNYSFDYIDLCWQSVIFAF